MEGNKDESERCLQKAETFFNNGDFEKALKFANKADRLYPSKRTKELINNINSSNGCAASEGEWESEASAAASSEASGMEKGSPGADGRASERTKHSSHASAESNSHRLLPKFTKEQQTAVQKILKCKDYYEILGLEKTCSDDDVKKAYKKMALKFHPDKNFAPGAKEAFQAISKAVDILTDPQKKRHYDEVGFEDAHISQHYRRYGGDYNDYDNGDMFAEEIFRMFFGGNFPRETPRHRRTARRQQSNSRSRQHTHQDEQQSENPYSLLLQVSPLVFLVFLSLISTFLIGDPAYSLQQNMKFTVARTTGRHAVQYFVKTDFLDYYADQVGSIESQVEEEYIRNLQQNCYREKAHRENNMWRARMYNNEQLFQQAKNLKTPSCDRLMKISNGR